MTVNVSQWRMEGLSRILKSFAAAVVPFDNDEEVGCEWPKQNARCDVCSDPRLVIEQSPTVLTSSLSLDLVESSETCYRSTIPLPPSLSCQSELNANAAVMSQSDYHQLLFCPFLAFSYYAGYLRKFSGFTYIYIYI